MKIITGATGTEHVTAADDGSLLATLFGTSQFVLPLGNQLEHEVISATKIRIKSGDLMVHGRYARIPHGTYDEVTVDNGATGYNRNDLIVCRYEETDGIESMTLKVVKGTPTTGTASDPTVITGNILNGDPVHEFPLYRVKLSGINLNAVERLFSVWNMNGTHNHDNKYYTESEVDTKLLRKQDTLKYTPVRQGGGTDQLSNTLYMGWSGSMLKAQVDTTDMGGVITTGNANGAICPVAKGGTGANNAADARTNLGFTKTAISLTRNTDMVPSHSTVTCYYVESEKRVYFRGYVATRDNKTYSSGTAILLWTVPEGYRPSSRHALAVNNGGSVVGQAYVGTDGKIILTARGGDIAKGNIIYITGWWDI